MHESTKCPRDQQNCHHHSKKKKHQKPKSSNATLSPQIGEGSMVSATESAISLTGSTISSTVLCKPFLHVPRDKARQDVHFLLLLTQIHLEQVEFLDQHGQHGLPTHVDAFEVMNSVPAMFQKKAHLIREHLSTEVKSKQ